jgi:hypothetical protein
MQRTALNVTRNERSVASVPLPVATRALRAVADLVPR